MPPTSTDLFQYSPVAEVVLDPHANRVVEANLAACRLLARSRPELLGRPASALFGEALPQWIVFTEAVLTLGESWLEGLTVTLGAQSCRRVELLGRRLPGADPPCLVVAMADADAVAERRQRGEAQEHYRSGLGHWTRVAQVFQEFERENHLILDAAGEGIYGVDGEGRTTFVNPAAERLLGWAAADLIGRDIHPIIHHTHCDGQHYAVQDCPIYQAFKDGVVRNVVDEVFWTRDGRPIDVEYTSTPIQDGGHLVGAVVIFRDVTERKRDQQRLLDALAEVQQLRDRLQQENAYLQEELNSEFNHHKIVGRSEAVQQLLQKIDLVAPTDATVLIMGESGTGKELIARAIHESSVRSQRPLIRVNCAAIPRDLFESEFFGHLKGAFTGATADRPGRFELADGGTLFLDEVGEIPFELQGKLLRVLQEQQFERVGESRTRHVNVRIIAATNRNLKERVEQGAFRKDLYFRLAVFPIESVPLRERRDDIPLLAQHFLARAARTAHKRGLRIPPAQMQRLQRYDWPGNIRELENIIERQVILAKGPQLSFDDLAGLQETTPRSRELMPESTPVMTAEEALALQRANLVRALRQTRGKVFGEGGAAELLGLKPTTLASRLRKWQIDPRRFRVPVETSPAEPV